MISEEYLGKSHSYFTVSSDIRMWMNSRFRELKIVNG